MLKIMSIDISEKVISQTEIMSANTVSASSSPNEL